ncbi:hypothetical protein V1515DRAFT_420702 [Lipomyces mesembrius]
MHIVQDKFYALYVSYASSIAGFHHCCPLIALDGTHLTSIYQGVLLIAVGISRYLLTGFLILSLLVRLPDISINSLLIRSRSWQIYSSLYLGGKPQCNRCRLHPGIVMTDMVTESFKSFAKDTAALAGGVAVWLATEAASFMNGRYMTTNWSGGRAHDEGIGSGLYIELLRSFLCEAGTVTT